MEREEGSVKPVCALQSRESVQLPKSNVFLSYKTFVNLQFNQTAIKQQSLHIINLQFDQTAIAAYQLSAATQQICDYTAF